MNRHLLASLVMLASLALTASAADTRMNPKYGDPSLVQHWESCVNNQSKTNGSCVHDIYGQGGYDAFTISFWLRLESETCGHASSGKSGLLLPHVWMMFCCDDGRPTTRGGPKLQSVLAKTGTGSFAGNLANTCNTEDFATSFYCANVTCTAPMTLTVGDEDFTIPATNKWIRNIKPNVNNADVSISGGGTYDFAIAVNPCHRFHATTLSPESNGGQMIDDQNVVSNEWTQCVLRARLDGTTCTMDITLDTMTGKHQHFTMTEPETDFSHFERGHLVKYGVFGQMAAYDTEHDVTWEWWNVRAYGFWMPDELIDNFYWRDRARLTALGISDAWTEGNR